MNDWEIEPTLPDVVQATELYLMPTGAQAGHLLTCTLAYSTSRPFEVLMLLTIEGNQEDTGIWRVSREVLMDAAINGVTAGSGDFIAEPKPALLFRGESMLFHFTTDWDPQAREHVERGLHFHGLVHASAFRSFIQQTLELVPFGSESEHYDMDAVLADLLS